MKFIRRKIIETGENNRKRRNQLSKTASAGVKSTGNSAKAAQQQLKAAAISAAQRIKSENNVKIERNEIINGNQSVI
jgi:hypothetical protein